MAENKIVGIFGDQANLERLLGELNNLGFTKDKISVLCKQKATGTLQTRSTAIYPKTGTGTTSVGTMTGIGTDTGTMERPNLNVIPPTDTNLGVEEESWTEAPDLEEKFDVKEKDPDAMVKGAATGGTVGLLAGLAALMIPGVGPVLAAGSVAAAIAAGASGAALGAAAGTVIGLFKDEGIPQDRAEFYNKHFDQGDVLVMVHVDDDRELTQVREILLRFNPATIDTF